MKSGMMTAFVKFLITLTNSGLSVLSNNTNSVLSNNTNTHMKLVEATYTQLASAIANSAKQITFLAQERTRIQQQYSEVDPEDGSYVQFIGQKLTEQLNLAIATLEACAGSGSDLLTQKLAEPVEAQLGLGLWQEKIAG